MLKILTDAFNEIMSWGVNSFGSVLISLGFIILCLPFSYIGLAARKAIQVRLKGYKGYNISKPEKHAIIGFITLALIEPILYFFIPRSLFIVITGLLVILIILGLLGFKFKLNPEELFEFGD